MGTNDGPFEELGTGQDELTKALEERDGLIRENLALKGRRTALESRVRELGLQVDGQLARIAELERRGVVAGDATGRDPRLTAERDALIAERDDLVRKLGNHAARTAELEARLSGFDSSVNGKEQLRELAFERDELRRQLSGLDEGRREFEQALEERDDLLRRLADEQNQLVEKHRRLETERAESSFGTDATRSELAQANASLAELNIRVAELEGQTAFDQRRIAVHAAERERLGSRATEAEVHAAEAEARATDAEARAAQAAGRREELARVIADLERELTQLQEQRATLAERTDAQRERLVELENANARRRDRIAELEQAIKERGVELRVARDEISGVRSELADQTRNTEATARELEEERRLALETAVERHQLAAELARARAELKMLAEQVGNLAAERDAVEGARDRVVEQRDVLLGERDAIARERSDLARRLQAHVKTLASVEFERDHALESLEGAERQLEQHRQGVGALEVNVERLEGQLRERELELADVRTELGGVRAHADELHATLGAARKRAADSEDALLRAADDRRLLVADLVRAQGEVTDLDRGIDELSSSRWYRLATATWRLRQRPRTIVAFALAVLIVAAAIAGGAVAGAPWYVLVAAGVVGAVILSAQAIRILRRLARTARPRKARSIARPVPPEAPPILERALEQSTPAAAEAPSAAVAPAAPEPAAVAPAANAPTKIVTKLVPAPTGATAIGLERQEFLAGARRLDPRELHVAGILDEMSRACFSPECQLNCAFTMEDWQERLEAHPPHLLLVESAWSGNGGGWQYGIASYTHPHYVGLPKLRALLDWCRGRSIPTVFWNKEDPVHFERFKEAAALFDHILTTDSDCIPAYETLAGEHVRSIGAMPFAAQPRLHNPIAVVSERRPEPVFAGTYYRNRHADRRKSLEVILDAARPFGLIIYDRTFGTTSDEYGFPERFRPHVAGRLPYDKVIDVYKSHKLFVNVNSVTDSPTMFSRRVFELLACGTAVVTTESVGIKAMFGDLVPVVKTLEEATAAIERILYDDGDRAELTRRAQRLVLAEHTYRQRLAQLARVAGFDVDTTVGEEVAVLALADDAHALSPVTDAVLAQSERAAEVIVGTVDPDVVATEIARIVEQLGDDAVRVATQDGDLAPVERHRELASLAATPWITVMGGGARYERDHLRELVAVTRYAEADVIGCPSSDAFAQRYVDTVDPLGALAARDLVASHGWADTSDALGTWFGRGVRFFAAGAGTFTSPTPTRQVTAEDVTAPERRRRVRRR